MIGSKVGSQQLFLLLAVIVTVILIGLALVLTLTPEPRIMAPGPYYGSETSLVVKQNSGKAPVVSVDMKVAL